MSGATAAGARARVLVAFAALVAAVASPPVAGAAIAALALGAVLVDGAVTRAWHAWRAPAITVAIAVALQAWVNGRHAAFVLGARVVAATSVSAWLVATLRPDEILRALRQLGAPRVLVELAALAARYVSVHRRVDAHRARGAAHAARLAAAQRTRALVRRARRRRRRARSRSERRHRRVDAGARRRWAAMIALDGSIGYRARPVLSRLRLRIGAGERVALVGGNGAGKTTLLRALMGLQPVDGSVTIDGRAIRRAEDAVAAGAGIVFQNPDDQLFGASVAEDVRFGPANQRLGDAECDRRVAAALAQLGLAALAARPIEELSFGEKKRACLAGVLAMRPRLLLLDEPTAGLDPAGEETLVELLAAVDATLVVATHAVDLVPRLCARTIVLGRGGVVADGPTADVLARADELRACNLRPPHGWAQQPLLVRA